MRRPYRDLSGRQVAAGSRQDMGSATAVQIADPKRAFLRFEDEISAAVDRVLHSGWYLGGEEVAAFEREFAEAVGSSYAIGVSSGTSALSVALMACGIVPGDKVATVSMTSVATIAAIEACLAIPVFVDVRSSDLTLDPKQLRDVCERTHIKAIVPVHLYGHPACMPEIMAIAKRYRAFVVEDCAHAHGARIGSQQCGTWGHISAFSFYPTKNLGALGDAGAITTADAALAEKARLIRQYGWRRSQISELPGTNARIDSIQAAILRVKLPHLAGDNSRRREIALTYNAAIEGIDSLAGLEQSANTCHVFHQFVIRSPLRASLTDHLRARQIETAVHYPVPVHVQPAYKLRPGWKEGDLPITEQAAKEVVSIPCYPDLTDYEVAHIAASLSEFAGCSARVDECDGGRSVGH